VVQNSRWLLGTGLLTAEGGAWKRQRRLIQPAFSRDRMATYANSMTDAAEQMLRTWRPGTVVDIHQEMTSLTLRVVVRALFELETMETGEISRSLNTIMLNSIGGRLLFPPFFRYLPLPGIRELRRAVNNMNTAVYEIIRQRRSSGKQTSGDLLSILMHARDEDGSRMTDEQVRDEIMIFLLAGHATTALALSWALYLLSRNAGAEEKLHEEVDRVLAGRLPCVEAHCSAGV
jgi:cytochrome P450